MPPDPPGPFEAEREARELPAVRAVYAAFDADPGAGKMAPHNQRMLLDALAQSGVYLGAYDHRTVAWLATWEPQTVAVIAGWVQRASQADDRECGETRVLELAEPRRETDVTTDQAVATVTAAARAEHDFGGWLSLVLVRAAAQLGSLDALTQGRPGSWEADLVDRLARGLAFDDEGLAAYRAPGGTP